MKRKSDTAELAIDKMTELAKAKKIKTAKPMPPTTAQKAQIAEFQSVTNTNSTMAAKLLKQHGWNTSAAVNAFFNNPSSTTPNPSRKALDRLFDSYRIHPRDSPNELDIEGTGQLLEDLQIGLEDIGSLVFFEAVASPQIGVITREGFVEAFADANADSLPKIRNVTLARRSELARDRALFKRVYNHTFTLLLEERKKAIDLDQAEGFWRVLFSPAGFPWQTRDTPWLDWWVEFLTAKWGKSINKDLWRQTLTFAEETMKDEQLTFWNEESSWPSVIDEFVEWVKTEKRPGGGGDNMDVE